MNHKNSTINQNTYIPHIEMIYWLISLRSLTEQECPKPKEWNLEQTSIVVWETKSRDDIAKIWEFHKQQNTPYRGSVELELIFSTIKQRGEETLSITIERKTEEPFEWSVKRTKFYVK
jgi:hypothetical protein